MGFIDRVLGRDEDDNDKDYEVVDYRPSRHDDLLEIGVLDFAAGVAPDALIKKENYIQVGDEYLRTLYVYQYPPVLTQGWLNGLYRFSESIDISFFVQPIPTDYMISKLRQKVNQDQAVVDKSVEDGILPDYQIQQRLEDNLGLIELMQRNEAKPYQIALIVTIRAKTVKELDRITELMERQIMRPSETRRATLRHHDGFVATLPALQNNIADGFSVKNVHSKGLEAFYPFTANELTHENGILIGINRATNSNVIVNRFDSSKVNNYNMAVFGASGSGKSYFAKSEILQWAMLDYPIIIVDPQDEYGRLCRGVGGQFISMGFESNNKINPLDFSHSIDPRAKTDPAAAQRMGNPLGVKITFVIRMIEVMLQSGKTQSVPLTDYQNTLLERALRRLYQNYGYDVSSIPSQVLAEPHNMPVLGDLHELLQKMALMKPDDQNFQLNIQNLIAGLARYVGQSTFARLFDHRTNVHLENNFIVFNILGVGDELMPIVMQLVLEFLRTNLFSSRYEGTRTNRLLYIDEAQRLMRFPQLAAFLEDVARTARKFGVGLTVLTQDTDVFLLGEDGQQVNRHGRGILNNCAVKMLLKQEPNALRVVKEVFDLGEGEAITLANAGKGEGLIYVGRDKAWVNMYGMMSPLAHQMITTDPNEVAEIRRLEHQQAQQDQLMQNTRGQIGPARPGLPPGANN